MHPLYWIKYCCVVDFFCFLPITEWEYHTSRFFLTLIPRIFPQTRGRGSSKGVTRTIGMTSVTHRPTHPLTHQPTHTPTHPSTNLTHQPINPTRSRPRLGDMGVDHEQCEQCEKCDHYMNIRMVGIRSVTEDPKLNRYMHAR